MGMREKSNNSIGYRFNECIRQAWSSCFDVNLTLENLEANRLKIPFVILLRAWDILKSLNSDLQGVWNRRITQEYCLDYSSAESRTAIHSMCYSLEKPRTAISPPALVSSPAGRVTVYEEK